jgi:hypothetical protein
LITDVCKVDAIAYSNLDAIRPGSWDWMVRITSRELMQLILVMAGNWIDTGVSFNQLKSYAVLGYQVPCIHVRLEQPQQYTRLGQLALGRSLSIGCCTN